MNCKTVNGIKCNSIKGDRDVTEFYSDTPPGWGKTLHGLIRNRAFENFCSRNILYKGGF